MVVSKVLLDVSRVGDRLIFKVTSLGNDGEEVATEGWHIAHKPNGTDVAMEEAQALASQWCQRNGLKTFTLVDHRL